MIIGIKNNELITTKLACVHTDISLIAIILNVIDDKSIFKFKKRKSFYFGLLFYCFIVLILRFILIAFQNYKDIH